MGGYEPRPVSVRGGADGIEAHYDDMVEAARLFGRAATDTGGASLALHGYLLDPGIYSSGLFDPVGAADFEAELAAALDGPGGLSWVAAEWGLLDVQLRSAAAAYLAADRLDAAAHDMLDGFVRLPAAAVQSGETLARTGSVAGALNRLLTADPELLDQAIGAFGGVRGTFAGGVSALLWDGHAVVRDGGVDQDPEAAAPPRCLADVMAGLALRNYARHGEIDVRLLTRADGSRAVIVDIPGTKSWDPLPNGDVTSLATNVRAVAGRPTAYEHGVLTAMQRAGVTPADDVMLVGHSEGGMVAVRTAIDATASGRFHISHVVTAGSPIGAVAARVPARVQVLALENSGDLVPHADGATNPDRTNITTVAIRRDHGTVSANHDIEESYLPGAADVDASGDASVRAFLGSAQRFFDARDVQTSRYVITRANW